MYHGGGSSYGDKIEGSGERIDSYLAISLTHIIIICVQELPEIELVAVGSATKECTSVEDIIYNAAVRGLIHILGIPALSLTHI